MRTPNFPTNHPLNWKQLHWNPRAEELPRYINACQERIKQIGRAARKAHRAGRSWEVQLLDLTLRHHEDRLRTYRYQLRLARVAAAKKTQLSFNFEEDNEP